MEGNVQNWRVNSPLLNPQYSIHIHYRCSIVEEEEEESGGMIHRLALIHVVSRFRTIDPSVFVRGTMCSAVQFG